MGEVHRGDEQHEHEIVEVQRIAQVEQRKAAAGLQPHAVVAAEQRERDAEVVQHLGEGERDHDEVDAARPDRHRADGERHQRRGRDRGAEMQPPARKAVEGENPGGVGPDAEIGRVAEGHHAAVAEDQVEADRRDGEDHDAPHEVDVERLAERDHHRRQREQQDDEYAPENQSS